jgi:hypothetical protein
MKPHLLFIAMFLILPIASAQPWCGIQTMYYQNDVAPDIPTYEQLQNYPSGATETDESVIVNSSAGYVWIDSYITPLGSPYVLEVKPGLRKYSSYAYVNGASGTTILNFSVFKRDIIGCETYFYSVETVDIDALVPTLYETQYVSPANLSLTLTDRIIIKVYGKTTQPSNIVLHWIYEGTEHYSHVESGYFECVPADYDTSAVAVLLGLVGGIIGSMIIVRREFKK